MKVTNVRFGFACNSSSTHSVVVVPGGSGDYADGTEDGGFGWSWFVLGSEQRKKQYLAALLISRMGGETAKRLARSMFGSALEGLDLASLYIDHQSVPVLPRSFGTKEMDFAFFDELCAYILRPDVAVYGGNDNDGRGHDLPAGAREALWQQASRYDEKQEPWVCRKDGDWWVVFNRDTGAKYELSFKDSPATRLVTAPELVDIKITDFCPYGCAYCYQGSTTRGEHAEGVDAWVNGLNHAQVFEVAIGGGEPTLHPKFTGLLERADQYEMRFNFTTRNLDYLTAHADLIRRNAGAFAISVDSVSDLDRACKLLERLDLASKATLQYVLGANNDWQFGEILRSCKDKHLRLTLLGYKTTGRGKAAKKSLGDNKQQLSGAWIDVIKKQGYLVAIDTAAAKMVPQGAFPEYLLRRHEGTHSMYVDAVAQRAHESSYDGWGIPTQPHQLHLAWQAIRQHAAEKNAAAH